MAIIEVEENSCSYHVLIREKGEQTMHLVTVADDYYRVITGEKISKAECVKESFRFLLEREPKEAILTNFDLQIIERYFPEYPKEMQRYATECTI